MLSKINEIKLSVVERLDREDGQALAEYGLILAFIFIVCVVALGFLGIAISGQLDAVTAGF